jgi:hypothetical protein
MSLPEIFPHTEVYFLRFSEDMIDICADAPDPKCAGAILCMFEYWTRVKLVHKSQSEIENAITAQGGLEPTQNTSLWIYKSAEDLQTETLGLFGIKKLRANREWLIEQGFLHSRNNPTYAWDHTLQYLLNCQNRFESPQNDQVENPQNRSSKCGSATPSAQVMRGQAGR